MASRRRKRQKIQENPQMALTLSMTALLETTVEVTRSRERFPVTLVGGCLKHQKRHR